MAVGLMSTYDLSAGVIVDMEPTIYWQNPDDVPLLGVKDYGTWDLGVPRGEVFEKKYEWLEDALLLPQSKLQAAITTSTATTFTVPTGEGLRFQANNVILVDAEYMFVSSVNYSTDTLTVTRGFNSSTAATHLINSRVDITGLILPEGSDPQQARAVDRVGKYNYTQIFGPEKIATTGTEDVIRKYGVQGREHDFQVAKRQRELWIGLEKAIINGDRLEDTGNERRSMGGLRFFITGSNVDSSTTTITESALLDAVSTVFDNGGSVTTALMNFKQKRTIGAFNSSQIRYAQMETQRGQVVDTVLTDGGVIRLGMDRWVKNSDLFLYNNQNLELVTLRPMQYQALAKTGDATNGMLVGEYGFKLHNATHAFRFSALT